MRVPCTTFLTEMNCFHSVVGRFHFLSRVTYRMVVRPMFSPPMTYSPRFSSIFTLAWFVSTRMDIVPCADAMYNISDRNEPFPSRCGPFPFFWPGLHTEWSFGLGFRLPWPITHVSQLFFILPWFVCTRMDIVPCAGAMYNISDRNELFPFRCGPFPFFV